VRDRNPLRPWMVVSTSLCLSVSCTPQGEESIGDGSSDYEDTPVEDTEASSALDTGEPIVDDGRIWPAEQWDEGLPEEHGMDSDALELLRVYAFSEGFNTQSVVVIKDGVLVAEWNAEGTDSDSLVTTWSAGKSVTSALIGVGIREGLLDLDDPIGTYISDWKDGPNAELTIRHLLEMRSGLAANWSLPWGVYSAAPDQLEYSLNRTPVRDPGTQFSYVNEDSMVLGEVIAQAFGQSAGEVAQAEIFGPLGMNAEWWTDGEGHSLTYCCIDTTARDFARFGLLYARQGQWDGSRVVPAHFVIESTTGISSYGYYGLHWWTYGEIFAAIGYHDQYLWVYPEQDLIVARFGIYTRHGDEPVREGSSYHETLASGGFDAGTFAGLFLDALGD
jgi:CubicO group peptidase (beta-lactamase class C family)